MSSLPKSMKHTIAGHHNDVPRIIALPIVSGNPDYLTWIELETSDPEQP